MSAVDIPGLLQQTNMSLDEYYQKFLKAEPAKIKPFIQPKPVNTQGKDPSSQYDSMEYLTNFLQVKSAFENVLDQLFSVEEKIEFLLSLGYSRDSSGKFYKSDSKASSGELDSLFLFEISIKFKNLLLAKGTLKLKL